MRFVELSKRECEDKIVRMSTINATIYIGDDSARAISGLLSCFPRGRLVRVAVTDEPTVSVGSKPDLVDWLLACPEKGWYEPMERGETTDDLKSTCFE